MSGRVVIAGGGTGGHIFTGLAVSRELKARGSEVHWLGGRRGLEAELVPGARAAHYPGRHRRASTAAARPLRPAPSPFCPARWRLPCARYCASNRWQSLGSGATLRPRGWRRPACSGVPVVLQEQNSIPGWTNRFLAPFADLICCGFEDAVSAFPSMPAEWTGNPVRADFFDVPDVMPHEPPRLLILGGSQGSLFINRTLPRALSILLEEGFQLEIRHQAGVRWAEVVRTAYQDLKLEATVTAFLAEPWQSLAEADLVVARSGALTISELAAAGRGRPVDTLCCGGGKPSGVQRPHPRARRWRPCSDRERGIAAAGGRGSRRSPRRSRGTVRDGGSRARSGPAGGRSSNRRTSLGGGRRRMSASPHLHLMGIGGVGMCGIAEVLLSEGVAVSGCDLADNERTHGGSPRSERSSIVGHDPGSPRGG